MSEMLGVQKSASLNRADRMELLRGTSDLKSQYIKLLDCWVFLFVFSQQNSIVRAHEHSGSFWVAVFLG